MTTSPSLLTTAHTVLSIAYYALIIAFSLVLSLALPFATFHLGRFFAGYHFDVGHPGSPIAVFPAFVVYFFLCVWGLEDEAGVGYFLVNVPFGVGVGCAVGLGVWMTWVGLVKAVRSVQGGEEKAKDS